jgi:hypothetical protein
MVIKSFVGHKQWCGGNHKFLYTGTNNYQCSFTFLRRVGFKPYPTEKRRVHCQIKSCIDTKK